MDKFSTLLFCNTEWYLWYSKEKLMRQTWKKLLQEKNVTLLNESVVWLGSDELWLMMSMQLNKLFTAVITQN